MAATIPWTKHDIIQTHIQCIKRENCVFYCFTLSVFLILPGSQPNSNQICLIWVSEPFNSNSFTWQTQENDTFWFKKILFVINVSEHIKLPFIVGIHSICTDTAHIQRSTNLTQYYYLPPLCFCQHKCVFSNVFMKNLCQATIHSVSLSCWWTNNACFMFQFLIVMKCTKRSFSSNQKW